MIHHAAKAIDLNSPQHNALSSELEKLVTVACISPRPHHYTSISFSPATIPLHHFTTDCTHKG